MKATVKNKCGEKFKTFILNEIVEEEEHKTFIREHEIVNSSILRFAYRFVLECGRDRALSGPVWTLEHICHVQTDVLTNLINDTEYTIIELVSHNRTNIEAAKQWIEYHTITTTPYKLATMDSMVFQYQ
jgi:hypothetical protein